MKILLVDDHEIVRRGLRQLLAEAWPEAEFGEVDRIAAARESLTSMRWDLVLLDNNLPDGSGLDLIADVRKRCPDAAVLVLSSYPEQEFAARAFKLGAAGYLTKSSVSDEMLLAARRVLDGGRYVSASLAEHLADLLGPGHVQAAHDALSAREMEVLRQVAQGRTIKEIAAGLNLSDKTIATYRARISAKLGLGSSVELTRYALQHGLVD